MNTIIDIETIPAVRDAANHQEVFWLNEQLSTEQEADMPVTMEQIQDAEDRLLRFAPYLAQVFPETAEQGGIIESELRRIPRMKQFLNGSVNAKIAGELYLKMDSHLPIAGSIKARGGIYEVLKHAEDLALKAGMLKQETANGEESWESSYRILAEPRFQEFFHQYTIQVGSTGNLGMSIGIMSAKLGFQVIVHMSADAKQWKKDLLRSRGVNVIEYPTDYCAAVEEGRKRSDLDEKSYFVDDENSVDLFLGYSVAAKRLQKQLLEKEIAVDETHPLFVYLPCGIGGAPGGVAYGLKAIFGKHVHCFFTEPVESCCMLLGMATGLHDKICVQDIGISGKTDADGLAVSRPSAFVGRVMEHKVSGICTILDQKLYPLMRGLLSQEDIFIEPSACAAFAGLLHPEVIDEYAKQQGLTDSMPNATHIAWATGGSMVPEAMIQIYQTMYC